MTKTYELPNGKMIMADVDEKHHTATISVYALDNLVEAANKVDVLDKIRAEITDCLKALDDIEKSGFNIYLPNEISGRRLTYQQCLEFIDKYKAESEDVWG